MAHRVVPSPRPARRRVLWVAVAVLVAVGAGLGVAVLRERPTDVAQGPADVAQGPGGDAPTRTTSEPAATARSASASRADPDPSPGPSSPAAHPSVPGQSEESTSVAQSTALGDQDPPCPGVRCFSLVVTGDVLLHPPLWEQALADAGAGPDDFDFGPLLAGQTEYVQPADLAVCHLETPLGPDGGPYRGYPSFRVPPEIARDLAGVGYDACSTASNHSLDDGGDGVDRTLDTLDAAGLAHAGTARSAAEAATPTLVERAGVTVGLVSATYGLNGSPDHPDWQVQTLSTQQILDQAAAARQAGAELVIVSVHAGTEYRTAPTDQQRDLAAALLADPDVDFVAGHHAHVVQPLEQINGKWVAYGLGNTVAAHEVEDVGNREGLLVQVRFSQDEAGTWTTAEVAWVPSVVEDEKPYRWCSLVAAAGCGDPAADAGSRARIAEAVNALGAADAGAHPVDRP